MNILYRITYLPHLNNKTPPYYYIGSKYDYKKEYWGSPSSSQNDWYTNGISIRDWWKNEIKNKNNFLFEIISIHNDLSPTLLVEEEKKIQIELDVKNNVEYFNKSIATTGWVSSPRTEETKKKISEITKKYWDQNTLEVEERKKSIKKYSHKISKSLIEKWNNPSQKMLDNKEKSILRLKNKSEEWKNKLKNAKRTPKSCQKVFCCGIIYENAFEASKIIGIDPVNIRRRCRLEKYTDWYYLQ